MITLEKFETIEVKQEEAVITPKFLCGSCERCTSDNRCEFYQRPVEPTENKCFNHSTYTSSPIKAIFKQLPKEIMDEIIAENEAAA